MRLGRVDESLKWASGKLATRLHLFYDLQMPPESRAAVLKIVSIKPDDIWHGPANIPPGEFESSNASRH